MFVCTVTATTKTCGKLLFKKLWNLSKINKHIDEIELGFYIKSRIKLSVGRNSRAHSILMHQISFIFCKGCMVEEKTKHFQLHLATQPRSSKTVTSIGDIWRKYKLQVFIFEPPEVGLSTLWTTAGVSLPEEGSVSLRHEQSSSTIESRGDTKVKDKDTVVEPHI